MVALLVSKVGYCFKCKPFMYVCMLLSTCSNMVLWRAVLIALSDHMRVMRPFPCWLTHLGKRRNNQQLLSCWRQVKKCWEVVLQI